MKHITSITTPTPAKAESLLVWGQKVALFTAFSEGLGAFAEGVSSLLGIGAEEEK